MLRRGGTPRDRAFAVVIELEYTCAPPGRIIRSFAGDGVLAGGEYPVWMSDRDAETVIDTVSLRLDTLSVRAWVVGPEAAKTALAVPRPGFFATLVAALRSLVRGSHRRASNL